MCVCQAPPATAQPLTLLDLARTRPCVANACRPQLVDFGFAKKADAMGRCYSQLGTPHYLAPELLDNRNKGGYSDAVDWWAFGCLVFEMLAGKVRASPL